MTDAALNSAAARFFFYFAVTRAANVIHKGRAQDSRDPIFGDDAAEFVRRDAQKREIEQARFFRKPILLDRNAGQRGRTSEIKSEHECVFGQQLLFAFFFFGGLVAISLNRKIAVTLSAMSDS